MIYCFFAMEREATIAALLRAEEPAVQWRVRVRVLGEDPKSRAVAELQQRVKSSPRVQALLAERGAKHVYAKWQGVHWALAALADVGYPSGDPALQPLRDWMLDTWLQQGYYTEFEATTKGGAYRKAGVPIMEGRHRRCASQQGNALYSLLALGLEDARLERLVERLLHWQWPDGGWNCDKNPQADTSSFMETLLPMRGLHLFGTLHNDTLALGAARKAAEVFLARRLFKSRSTGQVIHPEFTRLHYPLYWHYDFLAGLKVLAELGLISDPRCADALDLLEQKELPSGGWPAQARYYKVSEHVALHADSVDWGGTSKSRMNPWVTSDALFVLRAAGRLGR